METLKDRDTLENGHHAVGPPVLADMVGACHGPSGPDEAGGPPLSTSTDYETTSQFNCLSALRAHEQGGVENEVGRFRRRHLVPVPKIATLAEINEQLRADCVEDLERRIVRRTETVGEALVTHPRVWWRLGWTFLAHVGDAVSGTAGRRVPRTRPAAGGGMLV